MSRHVVVINQFALPRTEGGGTRHIDLFSRVKGWEPLVIAGNRNHYTQRRFHTDDPRFRLLRVPPQRGGAVPRLLGWTVFGLQALAATLTRRELDLVYGSSPQPFAALAGLLAARLRRVPFVLEVRDLWPESIVSAGKLRADTLPHRLFRWLERVLARAADRIVCVTSGWEAHFATLGVGADRIVVVPNGTEPEDFNTALSKEELRARHGIDGFTAIFAGAHGEKDGIDLILEAALAVPEVNILLVGSGPAKPAAVEKARRLGLTNVTFREPVPKCQLAELLRACDVGIHAVSPLSVFEHGMSPNKLFDYLAAELPVVSNAAGPLRQIIRDGECGRLGDSQHLAECLRLVQTTPASTRRTWSQRSHAVLDRFSPTSGAHTLAGVLDGVFTRRRCMHR